MTCNMPNIEVLSNYMFSNCNNLYKVDVPNANDVGTSVFEYCYSLENVDFPNVTWINDGAFDYCYIDTLYAPKCVTLWNGVIGRNRSRKLYQSHRFT